jgi:hypothetical protein
MYWTLTDSYSIKNFPPLLLCVRTNKYSSDVAVLSKLMTHPKLLEIRNEVLINGIYEL